MMKTIVSTVLLCLIAVVALGQGRPASPAWLNALEPKYGKFMIVVSDSNGKVHGYFQSTEIAQRRAELSQLLRGGDATAIKKKKNEVSRLIDRDHGCDWIWLPDRKTYMTFPCELAKKS